MRFDGRHLLSTTLAALLLGLAVGGCHGSDTPTGTLPEGTGTRPFTVAPVKMDSLSIIALGWLSPPPHTTPSDHIYLIKGSPVGRDMATLSSPVYAVAGGVVIRLLQRGPGDTKLTIAVTSTFRYYFDHLNMTAGLTEGSRVTTGQVLGDTKVAGGVDFGVINEEWTNPFVNPSRYGDDTRHADSPIKYFVEPLRSQLYAKVWREGADKDGRIAQDVAGTLAGNWFLEGLPNDASSMGPDGWNKQLAFVADPLVPSRPRVSIGGQLASSGLWTLAAGDPPFASITPASGQVQLHLTTVDPNYPDRPAVQIGMMLVQLLAPDRLRAEVFPSANEALAFTGAAKIYLR
jgi:hypothetical protein